MQINRLNLIFPPNTPAAPVASAQPEALQTQADNGSARAPAADLGTMPTRKSAAVVPEAPASVAPATTGVTVELGSGQKAAASGVYTRAGVVAGRASAAVDQTPAEQFVASAVNILRDFDISKSGVAAEGGTTGQGDALPASRFGSFGGFKQAVAKLNVFA